MPTTVANWPDPNIAIGRDGYKTSDGVFPRVTSILRVIGGDKVEGLIRWAATEERKAVLEAAGTVLNTSKGMTTQAQFIADVEKALGPARQHQKQLQKGGEIGSAVHQAVHEYLRDGAWGVLADEALRPVVAFQEWWGKSGLKAVRMEQPVWDSELGYAGTIDLIAEHPEKGLGLIDFKTSKGIYDEHHIQVAAYMHAAQRWAHVKWAEIVRLPKSIGDPDFEVRPLGAMYNRQLTRDDLMEVFKAALTIHKLLVAK